MWGPPCRVGYRVPPLIFPLDAPCATWRLSLVLQPSQTTRHSARVPQVIRHLGLHKGQIHGVFVF